MAVAALRRFQERAASIEVQPLFDRRSLPIYSIVVAALALAVPMMLLTGFTVSRRVAFGVPSTTFLFLSAAWAARRYSHKAVAGWLECLALAGIQGTVLLFVLYPLTALSGQFADDQLAYADKLLGFDWANFTAAMARHPVATDLLIAAYRSFGWQPPLLLAILFFTNRGDRGWETVSAATIALVIASVVFLFFPCEGAFLHSRHLPAEFGRFATFRAWDFGPIIHLIKDGGVRRIDGSTLSGLVSFPSYHATTAAIMAWAAWPTKGRWVFLPLNVAMAVAAIPVGAHYLVDILAGCAVAAISILLASAVGRHLSEDPSSSNRTDGSPESHSVQAGLNRIGVERQETLPG
jgi:membrane-associated phospholipid phosphatase